MGNENLHVFILPMLAHGHMIPSLDMAKLFASRGLKTTVISTPAFSEPVKKAQESGYNIHLEIIDFPHKESGLPDHVVSLAEITGFELLSKFLTALDLLQGPVERLIEEQSPDCLVSDMFFPWSTDSASKFGIPRLIFHGTGCLSRCALEQVRLHKPFENVCSDSEPFIIPSLPHQFEFVRTQIPEFQRDANGNPFSRYMELVREADHRSYGVLLNTFYELEHVYADHYRDVLGRKTWNIGPLWLHSSLEDQEKARRGREPEMDTDTHECLTWLDSKKARSVVYVCFGSMVDFSSTQLNEIAIGLECSSQDFLWVVRKSDGNTTSETTWMPQGYKEKVGDRGFILRGWAPQLLILDHEAIGAFVTHCGWNSTLEAVCAGLPMVTWPLYAEQFYNEKLVVEVLRIGISVGNKRWQRAACEGVSKEAVDEAVREVMIGENMSEMRTRANYYQELARKAVVEGGSSYNDLHAFIGELNALKCIRETQRVLKIDQ